MKINVIIAEYNPFHMGHKYHLEQTRENNYPTFVIQSGAFVQRGEAAILDKYDRALTAVKNGVDIVFELPFPFSSSPADKFALGAFKMMQKFDAQINLSFGSEDADLQAIMQTASIILEEPPTFKEMLRDNLNLGVNYVKSLQNSLNEYAKEKGLSIVDISKPNNILAVEYAKTNLKLGTNYTLTPIKRHGDYRGECSNGYYSASQIRKLIQNAQYIPNEQVPPQTKELIKQHSPVNNDSIYLYSILQKSKEELSSIFDVNEGLENKLIKEAKKSVTLEELISNVSNARYTQSRIRRILTYSLLNLSKKSYVKIIEEEPTFNLLSANKKSTSFLSLVDGNIITSQSALSRQESLIAKYTAKSQEYFKLIRGYSKDHALIE